MKPRPIGSSTSPPGRVRALGVVLILGLLSPLAASGDVFNPEPSSAAPTVPVGDKATCSSTRSR